jgi:hypothetical protein
MTRKPMAAAALLLVLTGCGDGGDEKGDDPPEPTGPTYVETANRLCEELIDDVVPITGDSAPVPDRARYVANRTALAPVYEEFDGELDEIEVQTDADRKADEAFDAYRAAIAALDEEWDTKVEQLTEEEWSRAYGKALDEFFGSPARQGLLATGIECPAR